MATRPKDELHRRVGSRDSGSDPTKATDAAVRRVLVESRQELLAFLRRHSNSREEAEDLLQRFSLRALERASDLRDVRTVRGWLGRILASTIADHQRLSSRRRRREVAMEQTDIESIADTPDSELVGAICNCLYKLLPTLKPDYAEVIWRADILGEPRKREPMRIADTITYGSFFDLPGADVYTVKLTIQRPGSQRPVVVDFKYDHRRS